MGLARISSPSVAASARAICRRGRNIERLEIGAVGAGLSIDYVRDDSRGSLEGDGGDGSDDAVVIVVVVEAEKGLATLIMHRAVRLLHVMIRVNLAVVMFESLDAVMFESPDGFRTVVVPMVIVAVTTGLAGAMAGTMAIAGVEAGVMMEAAMTVAEVDEMTGHLAVAEIWDAGAIWVVLDEAARFSLPARWSKARLTESSNFTHGDMVFFAIRKETMRRKTPTRLFPVRLLRNTSCDKVSSFEAMSGRALVIRDLDSAKLNSSMGLLQRSTSMSRTLTI